MRKKPISLLIALLTTVGGGAFWADTPSTALVAAARARTRQPELYDGSYRVLAYPLGDVPSDRGVCTDLIVRAYRTLGIDLQVLVHEDMRSHFEDYPRSWGLRKPDRNIDYRRVPNLQRFFERAGASMRVTSVGGDYVAGDLVTWMLPGNLPHIGIVSDQNAGDGRRPKIIHNIGAGPVEDDILFAYRITGHYRYQISNQSVDRSKPPPAGPSPGGFTVRRLSGPVPVDGRLWIALNPVVGVRTVRAPNGQFTVSLDRPNEEGDVTRFRLSFTESGGRPVALVSDVVSYAFITGDSRWIVFEPVDVIDVRAWRRYTLSKLFDIGPYAVVKAMSPDGRRLLISRRDCPFDCPNDRTEYYEIGFPAT